MSVYNPRDCVVLTNGRSPFGELLNMTGGFPIKWFETWLSSEALYQACRFPENKEVQDEIRAAGNGFEAKQVAYKYKELTRSDWHDGINVEAMAMVLQLKRDQHPRVAVTLAQTEVKPIVELSRKDEYWGAKPRLDGMLEGENVLGKLWMLIRRGNRTAPSMDILPRGLTIEEFFA
jgi:predicted NAD-dependent protein-ADP-ribosyltransferase YbiA (DUF1768 family)